MRIKIVRRPSEASIDGIQLDRFEPGYQYEVGNSLGALLLAEGWAEPVPFEEPALLIPFSETETLGQPAGAHTDEPPNLVREIYPPHLDDLSLGVAADVFRPRRRR